MIASQKIGKSFMGALNYNLKKLNHPVPSLRAELLATNFASLDPALIKQEVDLMRSLKPNLNRYVYHTSLNFSKDDFLSNQKLLNIALTYLKESGYDSNQYLIFRHHDADHPHIHLLVNRIGFDGKVVSDSNNYKKSEAILRKLEIHYSLQRVEASKEAPNRAVKKDEIEMVLRTGLPSAKMLLQEKMKGLLSGGLLNIQDLILKGEKLGINFLFNQASTGRVTGITYFYDGFKIKGQALGNRFKWAELINKVNYEQIRDRKAINEANHRTTAKYGTGSALTGTNGERGSGTGLVSQNTGGNAPQYGRVETENGINAKGFLEADQDADILDKRAAASEHDSLSTSPGIEITDDIDDEAIHGRNRHKERKARTNRR